VGGYKLRRRTWRSRDAGHGEANDSTCNPCVAITILFPLTRQTVLRNACCVMQAVARAAGDLAASGAASFVQLRPLWALLDESQPPIVRVAFLHACPPVLRALAAPPPPQTAAAPGVGDAAANALAATTARAERVRAMAAAKEPVSVLLISNTH
jgi:hypothetical protein